MLDRWRAERLAMSDLKRFWDDFVQSGSATDSEPIDPALETMVRRIYAQDNAPTPDPYFATRLMSDLMRSAAASWQEQSKPASNRVVAEPGAGRLLPIFPIFQEIETRRRIPGRWALASAAIALVIVIASVAGFLIRQSGDGQPTAVIPAISEATPNDPTTTGQQTETLMEQHFPAGSIPFDERNQLELSRFSVAPGKSMIYESPCDRPPHLSMDLIESGSLSATALGQMQVLRAGGASESIPPDTAVNLEDGDRLTYYDDRNDDFAGFRSTGTDPLTVLELFWESDASPITCVSTEPGIDYQWSTDDKVTGFDSSRAITVKSQKVTLQPGQTLSDESVRWATNERQESDLYGAIVVESGTLEHSIVSPGDPFSGPDYVKLYKPGESLSKQGVLALSTKDQHVFRNPENEPLELIILNITYDEPASSDRPDP
jgi:hypothetical protein